MRNHFLTKTLVCISMMFTFILTSFALQAQNPLNDNGDNIVGTYSGKQGDDRFRVKIVKLTDGTYRAQVIWLERDKDANGNKILDVKNPDTSLRTKPADQVILFSGLKYNAKKHRWDDTKIYDPQRGFRAHMTAEFTSDGRLCIKGSLMGISESVYWQKVK